MARRTRREIVEIIQRYCEETGLTILLNDEIRPGDHYVACRNTGPELLVCMSVDPRGWISPVDIAYSYDIHECVKVIVPK